MSRMSLDDTGSSNLTWDDPSLMLLAMRVMIDNSSTDMTPFGGIDYEAAAPITKMPNEHDRQIEPQGAG